MCRDVLFLFFNGYSNIPFRFIFLHPSLFHLAILKKYVNESPVLDLPYAGFGLVFGTWPVVFNQLPGGIHWVRLIFFNLWLLGIDSAFAFLEAFLSVLSDTGTYKIQFNPSSRLSGPWWYWFVFVDIDFSHTHPYHFYEFSPTTQCILRKFPVSGSQWACQLLGSCSRCYTASILAFRSWMLLTFTSISL